MTKKANPIRVQIYEIQTPREAEQMVALGVDHVGSVILSPDDWKVKGIKETVDLVAGAGKISSLIPLFSDLEAILRVAAYYRPHMIHFCEDLVAWERMGKIDALVKLQEAFRTRHPEVRIMRSIPIAASGVTETAGTLALARLFEPVSDCFLTDTLLAPPPGGGACEQPVTGFVGITGRICRWDTAARLVEHSRIPVILAGGISPENVFDGIMKTRPAGVDSCTCTNRIDADGRPIRFQKDVAKVRQLVSEVRRAERALETMTES